MAMPTPHPPIDLYTAGYEGTSLDDFVAKLKAAGVTRVVDTRYTPLSRKRGFSKTPLLTRLAEEGIEYVHLKEVGTPKPWRDEYKRTKDFGEMSRKFDAYLDERGESLHRIMELAGEKPTVLICFEADPGRCHRSLVARRIASAFGPVRVIDL